jgi:23S rRNA pseudouridine1911/1915/1917 synthase
MNRKGQILEVDVKQQWTSYTIEQLIKNVWNVPKKLAHELRMTKGIFVNGKIVPWHTVLTEGDTLSLNILHDIESPFSPSFEPVEVLYEDEVLVVVNKPASLDTHPNHPTDEDTLLQRVCGYCLMNGEIRAVQHVHRLDRDTSGAVLFAKVPFVKGMLDRQLETRNIKRTYMALVHGVVQRKQDTISAPIGRDRHHPIRRRVSRTGQYAVTHYRVLETYPKDRVSLVECTLDTGRTHQIRVHMSSIGHPLVGDTLYGGKPVVHRQALHAKRLTFVHPLTQEKITCEAPIPDSVFKPYMD